MRLFLLWKRHSTSYQLRLKQTYAFLVQRVSPQWGLKGMSRLATTVAKCSEVYARRRYQTGVISRGTLTITMH